MGVIITKKQFMQNKKKYLKKIRDGAVFIYPTDTIYGIGCVVVREKSIRRIRKIKERGNKPFSIIVHSKKWITKNCKTNDNIKKYLNKLPGRYTLILELKNKKISPNPGMSTIGIRIPKHWIVDVVRELKLPIITTSVNKSNQKHMTSLRNADKKVLEKVDFIIYEKVCNNKPSKVIQIARGIRVR